ncbi:MAG: lytic transglycosylase domain-containing protein [Candidatus Parcubacteria bacterium]|nr:lytic transglycosylase domain-containing protein [Candidatus Parcubacteria bacterium]
MLKPLATHIFNFFLGSSVVFCLIFLNVLHKETKDLRQQNKTLSEKFNTQHAKMASDIFKLTENLSIIDASIDPDNKHWEKIKQVRKVVLDILKSKGRNDLTIKEITDISSAIVSSSEENALSISLILAVITVESGFRINAVSKAGAKGLMQILPDTASEISVDVGKRNFNLFRIKDNIHFGGYYLWKMINFFGDQNLGINAYNCGPACVERVRSGEYSKYPDETINYLKSVNEWKTKYSAMGVE